MNALLNLLINLVLPIVILTRLTDPLGAVMAFTIAVAVPVGYGIIDFIVRKKYNVFSVIGIISIALTGGIGLLHLPPKYIAFKEAGIPLLIGLVFLASQWTKRPLFSWFIEQIIDMSKVPKSKKISRAMYQSGFWFSLSFFISAVLNYILAIVIVTADPGTSEFNSQIASMTAWSYPVIAIPLTIMMVIVLYWLLTVVAKESGKEVEDLIKK